jgi:hypothetical protein
MFFPSRGLDKLSSVFMYHNSGDLILTGNHDLRGHSVPGRVILHPHSALDSNRRSFPSLDRSPVGVHANSWKIRRTKTWYVYVVMGEDDLRVI